MTHPRRLRLPRLVLVLGLVAAACGGSDFQDEGGGDQAAGDQATNGDGSGGGGGVELELAGFSSTPAEDQQLNAIIDQYNEQSENTASFNPLPEYDTTLQSQLAAGDPPDVFYVNDNRLPDLAEAGTLMPAEGRIDEPDDFYEPLVEAFTYEDTWYCPAKDFSTLALEYNTAMLEEAGVEPPTNWEELAAAAEQLTTDGRVGLVLAPEWFRWGVFAEQAGGGITNEDDTEVTADSEPVKTAMQYLQELHAQGFAATHTDLDAGWPGEAFGQEKAAMTIEGNWLVPAMTNDFPDVEYGVVEVPEGPAGPATFSFSVCYAVAQNAPNPDASWDLVNYLVSRDAMLAFTQEFPVIPSRESIRDQWLEAHPDLQPFLDSVEFAQSPTYVPGFQAVLDQLNSGIQGLATGGGQVEPLLQEVQQTGETVIGG